MDIVQDKDLSQFNTLKLSSICDFFLEACCLDDIKFGLSFAKERGIPWFILGGGSNVVLSPRIKGLVIKINLRGVSRTLAQDSSVLLTSDEALFTAAAGENWHQFVRLTIEQGFGGLENLSLIPGTVGAAPIQNIGAYGVELAQHVFLINVWDVANQVATSLSAEQCSFGYRDSLFKREPGRYIVLEVQFKLSRVSPLVTSYGPLKSESQHENRTYLSLSEEIIAIRRSKLPDPSHIPNAGSFFKNPIISSEKSRALKDLHPDIPLYPDNNGYKLAAGWLIEKSGWKGFRNEHVGVHDRQALVLINHNRGNAHDIINLAKEVAESVYQQFGVLLETEPQILGQSTLNNTWE